MNKLPDKHPCKKYTYSLPYTEKDIMEIYNLGFIHALEDVLALVNGEVINGTLKGVVSEEAIRSILSKVSGDSSSVSNTVTICKG